MVSRPSSPSSQPLAALLSQSVNPVMQPTSTHVPFWQAATPFGNEQTFPQAPQLVASVWRSLHCPLQHDLPVAEQLAGSMYVGSPLKMS